MQLKHSVKAIWIPEMLLKSEMLLLLNTINMDDTSP